MKHEKPIPPLPVYAGARGVATIVIDSATQRVVDANTVAQRLLDIEVGSSSDDCLAQFSCAETDQHLRSVRALVALPVGEERIVLLGTDGRDGKPGLIPTSARRIFMPLRTDVVLLTLDCCGHQSTGVRDRQPELDAFMAIADAVFDVYYDWDLVGDTCHFSSQYDALLGHSDLGTQSFGSAAFEERLHPADRRRHKAKARRCIAELLPFQDEYGLRREDGTYARVTEKAIVLADEFGQAIRMMGVLRDMSHEGEAERALRELNELRAALVRDVALPVLEVSDSGRCIDANVAALRLLRVGKAELIGGSLSFFLPKNLISAVNNVLAEPHRAGSNAMVEASIQVRGQENVLLTTLVSCAVGGRRSVFVIGVDVTEERELKEQLRDSERHLREQASMLTDSVTALKVVLRQTRAEAKEFERAFNANLRSSVQPLLASLENALRDRPEYDLLDAVRQRLNEVCDAFGLRVTDALQCTQGTLTEREFAVLNLVKAGRTSQQISGALHISSATVAFHRAQIRRKLGIPAGGPQLCTYLASCAREHSHERSE